MEFLKWVSQGNHPVIFLASLRPPPSHLLLGNLALDSPSHLTLLTSPRKTPPYLLAIWPCQLLCVGGLTSQVEQNKQQKKAGVSAVGSHSSWRGVWGLHHPKLPWGPLDDTQKECGWLEKVHFGTHRTFLYTINHSRQMVPGGRGQEKKSKSKQHVLIRTDKHSPGNREWQVPLLLWDGRVLRIEPYPGGLASHEGQERDEEKEKGRETSRFARNL